MTADNLPQPGRLERRTLSFLVGSLLYRNRKGGSWPVPEGMEKVTARGRDGSTLIGLHAPHPDPHGIVVLVHPDRRYGKQWFVRDGWFGLLADHGFAAYAFDLTPYGESHGGLLYLHEQVLGMVDHARAAHPGVPLHVIGLSIGAYAAMNASPEFEGVHSLALESPYPDFDAWYEAAGVRVGRRVNTALRRFFEKSYTRIDGCRNIARARVDRILVAATRRDEITPTHLSRQVAQAAPPDKTTYVELDDLPHLSLFQDPGYREAILRTLKGEPVAGKDPHVSPVLLATPPAAR